MPRMPRINIEGALYHTTSRGDNNRNIFKDNEDFQAYVDLLKKYKEQHGFKLFAYVLDSSQLNLLIELVEGVTISQIMHDLNSSYIKYFNKKYDRTGHLFTERYRCVLIEKMPWLGKVIACMHSQENPFSSYALYVKNELLADTVNIAEEKTEGLESLDGRSYADFVEIMGKDEIASLSNALGRKRVIGSKEFKKKIDAAIEAAKEDNPEEEPEEQHKKRVMSGVAVGVMLLLVGALYSVNMHLQKKLVITQETERMKFEQKIKTETKVLKQNLQERYAADMVSYRAMQKRMEIEKKRIKELEAKIEE
ncbi:MAG: hypothetical protein GY853_06245 [PVC group bacterium]|nr:hypothetical protein [PVC group bacterium]